jgi:hypothetical protein
MGKGFDVNPDGQIVWHGARVVQYASAAGILRYITPEFVDENAIAGTVDLAVLEHLRKDRRFVCGFLHKLHPEVGTPRTEFRSHSRELHPDLPRSLQVVVNTVTGRLHADVDKFSPYSDVVGWIGHAGEVVAGWFRRRRHIGA